MAVKVITTLVLGVILTLFLIAIRIFTAEFGVNNEVVAIVTLVFLLAGAGIVAIFRDSFGVRTHLIAGRTFEAIWWITSAILGIYGLRLGSIGHVILSVTMLAFRRGVIRVFKSGFSANG